MLRCGLLGKVLGHSYSPAIHAMLGDYSYELFEKTPEELPGFIKEGPWDGLNVTIPYKKAVVPFCSELSEIAKETGSVNTLIRRPDGTIFGDNTDAPGFAAMIRRAGIRVENKKVLVLGSGGASAAVCAALKRMNAEIVVISRSGQNNYENLDIHKDADVIVNTTPVGMYPDTPDSLFDLDGFDSLSGVADVIYNPARTVMLLQAEKRGISCANGLYMLVAQAKKSAELFTRKKIDDDVVETITGKLDSDMENIILIGMPGSGKSVIAKKLAAVTGRPVFDSDEQIVKQEGRTIPEIFKDFGEEQFRIFETEALCELGKASGTIISTGGGCVTKERNYDLLHQNGRIIWIRRDITRLARKGRPLSAGNLEQMYEIRRPMYERFADAAVENDGTPEEAVKKILEISGLAK